MGVKVLLVDDHPIVLLGLRNLLQARPEFDVVGEATDGLSAFEMLRRCKPDVLVVDLMLPDMDGFEVLRHCKAQAGKTKAIVLSMHANEAYMVEAFRSGAMAYVLKDALPDDLVHAILAVVEGRRYLSATLLERVIQAYINKRHKESGDPYTALTDREREVFGLAVNGRSNPQIAMKLAISPRTVEIHRANMMRKLNLRHQSDLIRYAMTRGVAVGA